MKRPLGLLAAITIMVLSPAIAQPLRFTLAIVRLDGRLVPFAAYDGGRWERAWPEADEQLEPPPTFENTQSVWLRRGENVPSVWQVWPSQRRPRFEAVVKGVEVVEAHCGGQVALTTSLPEVEGEHPHKVGVAVDSNVPIAPIEEVLRSDATWGTAQKVVSASFNKFELEQARGTSERLPRETPPPAAEITELYRETQSRRSPMYFVAEKKYRTLLEPPIAECNVRSIMTGWLLPTRAGGWVLRDHKMFVTDCDASDARSALPLAALHVSGKLFWVLQEHGYEDETYIVAEIGISGVRYVIDVSGGGC